MTNKQEPQSSEGKAKAILASTPTWILKPIESQSAHEPKLKVVK